MADGDRRRRRAVLSTLAVFALPPVTLLVIAGTDLSVPSGLVMAVVAIPLFVVAAGLAVIAREVASSPDEPVLVEQNIADNVGMTSEEYEDLLEQ